MITQEELKKRLSYDPETGVFVWIGCKCWNGRIKNGDEAGWKKNGYILIAIDGDHYRAHRLAWLYVYGRFPELHLDHINGDGTDNRIANLRECSVEQNCYNKDKYSNNKSGYKGVSFYKRDKTWEARCKVGDKYHFLGRYKSPEEAGQAYIDFAKAHHGEFFNQPLADNPSGMYERMALKKLGMA